MRTHINRTSINNTRTNNICINSAFFNKRLFYKVCLFLLLFSILLVPAKVQAADLSVYNSETVFDYADLLTTEEENSLRAFSEKFIRYDISVVFLTTNDTSGASSMYYSNDFYDTHSFRPDGALFMIDMYNREIYIDTVGTCIDTITRSDIDHALNSAYYYATEGNYYHCLSEMSELICEKIENHENPLWAALRFSAVTFLIAVTAGTVTAIILVSKHSSANKQTSGAHYVGSNFSVKNRNVVYMGCRNEVIPGYYNSSDRGSSGCSRSHTSSRGVSHGGGGRKF